MCMMGCLATVLSQPPPPNVCAPFDSFLVGWCLVGVECPARWFKDRDGLNWVLQKWEDVG